MDKRIEVAVKILVPLDPRRYLREIKILRNLSEGANIVRLVDLVRDPATNVYAFVFEWVEFYDWRQLYATFTPADVKTFFYKLLEALDYAHSRGIMHRDIKPQNIAIDKKQQRLRLLDWGLADFYRPRQKYNSHVATRVFKPPELLINYPYYDYSMDLWSAGLTFSIMMSKEIVFKSGENDQEQLIKMAEVVGGQALLDYAASLNVRLEDSQRAEIQRLKGTGWDAVVSKAARGFCPPEALDLLKRLMVVDHRERLTAAEAMRHPYFESITRRRGRGGRL